jgi:cytochrome c oxidase assembly protein subunit 15
MLTVTWLLKPLIVTAHLIFGMTTLALLWWGWLRLQPPSGRAAALRSAPAHAATPWSATAPTARIGYSLAVLSVVVLAVQFFLGGWTSANYAAFACPDFPTCQGAWWPQADFRHAFVLWRGLWIDYDGGILSNPARVAIHLSHRLGALAVTVTLLTTTLFVIGRRSLAAARARAYLVLAALGVQLAIGISMVLTTFPLWLTTAHTAGAALLLMAILALTARLHALRAVRPV